MFHLKNEEYFAILGCFFGEYSNMRQMKVFSRTLLANEAWTPPQNEKLAIALLIPYKFKNKLRTIKPQIFEKIKNNQPELQFTGSYKEGCNGKFYLIKCIAI